MPEALYPEIAANDAQRGEWVRLFAIDEIEENITTPGYSEPLAEDFLRANPFLVLDTMFFSHDFKDELLTSIEDLDGQTDGLLVESSTEAPPRTARETLDDVRTNFCYTKSL